MVGADGGAKPTYKTLFLSQTHYLRGEWNAAKAACEAATAGLRGDRSNAALIQRNGLDCLMAQIHYERNALDAAAARLARVFEELDGDLVADDTIIDTYAVAARLAYARGGLPAAQEILGAARAQALARPVAQLADHAQAWDAELRLLSGSDEVAAVYAGANHLRRVEALAAEPQCWREYYVQALLYIRASILAARLGPALDLALRLRVACLQHYGRGLAAGCDVQAALALKGRGEVPAALEHLEAALDFAIEEQSVRLFLDAGTGIESLIQCALRRRRTTALAGVKREFLHRLLRALHGMPQEGPETLSHREFTVLRELCRGRSNKSIGRTLDLSENTVKFHLKRIYRKLDVGSRDAALAAVQGLDIARKAG